MSKKIKLGFALFFIGSLGVASLLTVDFPTDKIPQEVLRQFSKDTLKYLSLINPILLLCFAVAVGTALYEKVNLSVPTLSSILGYPEKGISFFKQIKFGIFIGILSGVVTAIISLAFQSVLAKEFKLLENKIELTLIAKLGYGGITEELLLRFGFMTLLVWVIFKISKKLNNVAYWIAIVFSAVLFGIGHLPVVYSVISQPNAYLLSYIIIGNAMAGVLFGWLYWKKGLESAMIAHIFSHLTMIVLSFL